VGAFEDREVVVAATAVGVVRAVERQRTSTPRDLSPEVADGDGAIDFLGRVVVVLVLVPDVLVVARGSAGKSLERIQKHLLHRAGTLMGVHVTGFLRPQERVVTVAEITVDRS